MNVELIYALFKLDDLYPERLPEIAIQLLEEGFDNESLLQLATLNNPNKEEYHEDKATRNKCYGNVYSSFCILIAIVRTGEP